MRNGIGTKRDRCGRRRNAHWGSLESSCHDRQTRPGRPRARRLAHGCAGRRCAGRPGYGEDAAAIEIGDETLVVSSDPLSLARERLGTLAVNVACNDVACSGATRAG
nr:AIR synthase related protein [Haladaptatus sp. R4]